MISKLLSQIKSCRAYEIILGILYPDYFCLVGYKSLKYENLEPDLTMNHLMQQQEIKNICGLIYKDQ